jgi:hypothetical protein
MSISIQSVRPPLGLALACVPAAAGRRRRPITSRGLARMRTAAQAAGGAALPVQRITCMHAWRQSSWWADGRAGWAVACPVCGLAVPGVGWVSGTPTGTQTCQLPLGSWREETACLVLAQSRPTWTAYMPRPHASPAPFCSAAVPPSTTYLANAISPTHLSYYTINQLAHGRNWMKSINLHMEETG